MIFVGSQLLLTTLSCLFVLRSSTYRFHLILSSLCDIQGCSWENDKQAFWLVKPPVLLISISKIPTSLFSFQFELVISSFSAGEINRHLTLSDIPGCNEQNNLNNWDQTVVPAGAPVLDNHHVFNHIYFWAWDIHFGPALHTKTWSCNTQFQCYTVCNNNGSQMKKNTKFCWFQSIQGQCQKR